MSKKISFLIATLIIFVGLFTFAKPTKALDASCVAHGYNVGVIIAACRGKQLCPTEGWCCDTVNQCPGVQIIQSAIPDTGTEFICRLAAANNQNEWYRPAICPFNEKVSNPANPQEIFGERYTFAQVVWIMNSVIINVVDSLFEVILLPLKSMIGATGSLPVNSNLAINLHPLSGIHEISTTINKFNIVTPVFAQGFGERSLDGVRELWAASRNTAYLLMVLLLVASGFLILFRIKISPQATVTLQVMIPKIILTLIMVTFSYAIAGLILDLIYVVINFVISIAPASIVVDRQAARTFFTGPSIPAIFMYYFLNVLGLIGSLSSESAIAGGLGIAFLTIILAVILIFLLAKVLWTLFKAYVSLLIQVIIAPWVIMLGLLPGVSTGFSSWLRTTIAHASVFIIVPMMFALNMLLWGNSTGLIDLINFINSIGGDPSMINNGLVGTGISLLPNLPMLGGVDSMGPIFNALIGFVILSLIPKSAEMIQAALKVPPFKYGSAIGESLAAPITAGRAIDSRFPGIRTGAVEGVKNFWARSGTNSKPASNSAPTSADSQTF